MFLLRAVSVVVLLGGFTSSVWAQGAVNPTPPPAGARAVTPPPAPLPSPVLDRIHAAHSVSCGVSKEEEDYSRTEDHGNRAAFDIDICKAIAVATLGSGSPLVIRSYPDEPAALHALRKGEIDVLASASPSVTNTAAGFVFSQISLYDGQGFLLSANPRVHTPVDLAGKRVCFLTGAAAEEGLHSYAAQHGISYIWYPFSEAGEMEAAFFTGNCDAITSDVTQLANIRGIDPQRIHEFAILPQLIRQDPLAVATLGEDVRFAAVVHWTLATLVQAEELGVTQSNVTAVAQSPRPELQQLLGQRYGTGTTLGLDPHWGAQVLAAVGNYGEIFARDLGPASPLGLDRGENRLWKDGGVMLATPLTDR